MNGSNGTGSFTYGRKLVYAGLNGVRCGAPVALNGQSLSDVMSDSAVTVVSLTLAGALAGASVGLLGSCLMQKRGRTTNVWMYGAVGTAIGLFAGVSWKSRKIASSLAHSAIKEMSKTRDEHWLEAHPIDYA
jgi:hypothetical protein